MIITKIMIESYFIIITYINKSIHIYHVHKNSIKSLYALKEGICTKVTLK